MKIIKILNNNAVYARDRNQNHVIVMGRGIGFSSKAGDRVDPDKADKIVRVDDKKAADKLIAQLETIPEEFFEIADKIIDYATTRLNTELNKNVLATLTDHIHFSVERYNKGILFPNPLLWEVKQYYPKEFAVGEYAVALVNERFGILLGEDEASFIANHLACARYNADVQDANKITRFISSAIHTIEQYFGIQISDNTSGFDRFVAHMRFLAQRLLSKQNRAKEIVDESFIDLMKNHYRDDFLCAQAISNCVADDFAYQLTDSDIAYLTVYIRAIVGRQ